MRRVVLLGDSIFDNAAYVAGGPDVIKQVQAYLPAGWEGILRAVDGHVTTDVPQLSADVERCAPSGVPDSAVHHLLSSLS